MEAELSLYKEQISGLIESQRRPRAAQLLFNASKLAARLGQSQEARTLMEQSVREFETFGRYREGMAVWDTLCGFFDETTEPELFDAALHACLELLGRTERAAMGMGGMSVVSFLAQFEQSYPRLYQLLKARQTQELPGLDASVSSPDDRLSVGIPALLQADRMNLRGVRKDLLLRRELHAAPATHPYLIARLVKQRARVADHETDLDRAVADGRDPSDYTEVRGVGGTGPFAQFESAKLELAETLEDIKRVSLDDKLRFRFIPLSWTELLGDMTASRAVILFVEEPGAARLFAAVLTMDAARPKEGRPKIQFRELPTASYERLPALKEQLRNGLAAVIDVSGTLREISDLLWVPLGDLPTDLTILLTPRLIGIPFESLFTADGKPVILRHTVRYAFGPQPGLARYPKLSSIRRAAVGVEDFSSVNRPLLPSSRLEVEQLRELLRARGTAVLPKAAMPRSGKDLFTETKPLDVIHISTHSRLDRTSLSWITYSFRRTRSSPTTLPFPICVQDSLC